MGPGSGGLDPASTLLGEAYVWLKAGVVLLGRPLAMISVVPFFSRVGLPGFMRTAIAAALVIPVWAPLSAGLRDGSTGGFTMPLLIAKEVLLGSALGVLIGIPFWIMITAGEYLDQVRGEQGRLSSQAGDDASVTGTLLLIAGTAVFVMSNGLDTIVHLLYGSWGIWKPDALLPALDDRSPRLLLGLLDQVTLGGFELALPALLCMLLAEATMLVITRMVPQIHLDDVATAARNLIFLIFMPIYVNHMVSYMRRDGALVSSALDVLRSAFAP